MGRFGGESWLRVCPGRHANLAMPHRISVLFCTAGGVNNSSFSGRTVSWAKTKRIKARVTKKRSGAKDRHEAAAVEGVSGKRTKKSQRKADRRERLDAKEAEEKAARMDVDKPVPAKKKAVKKAVKVKKTTAMKKKAPAAKASAAPAPMQE